MRFTALASSSHGNAYLVDDGQTRILIECGLSHRKLKTLCDFSLSEVDAVLISHEHKDHAQCVTALLKDGMQVYMSFGTAMALQLAEESGAVRAGIRLLEDREIVTVGSYRVVAFATFHDAAEPLGFLIYSMADGESLAFATDTVNLQYRFPGVTMMAVEANYDPQILERCERMPEKVKKRITNCHMEIGRLCDYLRQLDLSCCRAVYLLHLSDATSHEGHFINKVRRVVPQHVQVIACPKEGSL